MPGLLGLKACYMSVVESSFQLQVQCLAGNNPSSLPTEVENPAITLPPLSPATGTMYAGLPGNPSRQKEDRLMESCAYVVQFSCVIGERRIHPES